MEIIRYYQKTNFIRSFNILVIILFKVQTKIWRCFKFFSKCLIFLSTHTCQIILYILAAFDTFSFPIKSFAYAKVAHKRSDARYVTLAYASVYISQSYDYFSYIFVYEVSCQCDDVYFIPKYASYIRILLVFCVQI